MNPILQRKWEQLDQAEAYACWYLVKQPTAFDSLCYLVSFLRNYQAGGTGTNLQDYISRRIQALAQEKPELEISDNYRALRVAAFFGLIAMPTVRYEDAVITDTYREILQRCGGAFERTDLYGDIIQRQLEKLYISSPVDEAYNGVRRAYRLYPVLLLYKILLELGRSTGSYRVSIREYRYLIATTTTYQGFLETLLLIRLMRSEADGGQAFDQFKGKFDNRLIQALKQLPTLDIDREGITLRPQAVEKAAEKVFAYENGALCPEGADYPAFLGSTAPLLDKPSNGEEPWEPSEQPVAEPVRRTGGSNVIYYGVPGSGKSWQIRREYCTGDAVAERLVFHPDYTYADFVGQILPVVGADRSVTYRFTPGPFTSLLARAWQDPGREYLLIIEEINRGNAPAIFGDLFQLLDRLEEPERDLGPGTSTYGIHNRDIAREVWGEENHEIRLPSNLTILATMNTSDQNVYPLDTAFQRRWEMRLVENSFDQVDPAFAAQHILDTPVTWKRFCTTINRMVLDNSMDMTSAEDKRLGVYFVSRQDLVYDPAADAPDANQRLRGERHNRRFPEKVLKYLWDDAFQFTREAVFDTVLCRSLEEVIRRFMSARGNDRLSVFSQAVQEALLAGEEA